MTRLTVTLALSLVSSLEVGAQAQPPKSVFGTWIWNASLSRADAQLANYRCYIERLDDLGNGKARMRDHRIRGANQVVRNDVEVSFITPMTRPDGSSGWWKMTGPRTYQMLTVRPDGSPSPFTVTREISEDGLRMTHIGEGLLQGQRIRNVFVFDRADDASRSDNCVIE